MMADDYADFDGLRESKYSHLLKPIRDLAENWNVDIANELEEYLGHLDRTAFAFEGGPSLDFAEAALLIQSSACVYSKKVEYLHNLVYQALEAVRSKRRNNNDVAGQEGGAQKDRPSRRDNDAEEDNLESFLAAGKDLKECEDVDLAGDDEAPAPAYIRPPAALLALEDQGSGQGDGDAGFYRLAQCYMHCSGALFLDMNDSMFYGPMLQPLRQAADTTMQQQHYQDKLGLQPGSKAAAIGDDDDDDDNDGVGSMDDDDDDDPNGKPKPAASQHAATMGAVAPGVTGPALTQATASGVTDAANGAMPAATSGDQQQHQQAETEYFDPYKALDMHSKGTLVVKPMRVRRPAKNRQLQVVHRRQPQPGKPGSACPALVNPEFAYAAELVQSTQRPQRKAPSHAAQRAKHATAPLLDWMDAAAAAQVVEDIVEEQAADADFAGDGPAGFGDDDDDFGGPMDNDMGDPADQLARCIAGTARPNFDAYDSAMADMAAASEGPTFEDACRHYLEMRIAAAAAEEVQTELAHRISAWRSKIDPVLQAEETRHTFDLQEYGDKIIGKLADLQLDPPAEAPKAAPEKAVQVVGFQSVAACTERYEVSRTFAAMLQLINNRNVAILKGSSPDQPFQLQLLSREMHHKKFGAKLAEGGAAAAAVAEGEDAEMEDMEAENNAPTRAAKPVKRPQKKAKAVAA